MRKTAIILLAVLLPAIVLAGGQTATSNSVQVIFPYSVNGVWMFDDADKGLKREPFVGAINPMLDTLCTNIPSAQAGIQLFFSATYLPKYSAKLDWRRADHGGNWYYCKKFNTEGWLCGSLLKYFTKPPTNIYIRVSASPKKRRKARKKY